MLRKGKRVVGSPKPDDQGQPEKAIDLSDASNASDKSNALESMKSQSPADASGNASTTPEATKTGDQSTDADIRRWAELDRPDMSDVLASMGISAEAVSKAQAEAAREGADLGAILVSHSSISEADWAKALGERFGLPVADVEADEPDASALAVIGEQLARRHNVLPFRISGDRVYVATADPLDLPAIESLISQCEHLGLMVAAPGSISRAIDRHFNALASADAAIMAFGLVDDEADGQSGISRATVDENAPIVQVVNRIITQGVRNRASDVHIEALEDCVRVRYRIDGALSEAIRLPQRMSSPIASRVKVLAELNIVERRRPQDGQFSVEIDGRPIDIRTSVVSTIHGEKVVLRLLDKAQSLIGLDKLGMPGHLVTDYLKIVSAPVGMFLCTGPTGSGKTTTLYATLTEIQDDTKNVVTIEDPVEYEFVGINQMQVHEAGGFTFADGLRGTLRQDPDVILVGEIRDAETAQIAMQASLTGHMVLSSLHAVDAVAAIHRFVDMGIEPFLVASAINGVMGQRLLRRICSSCRVEYDPPTDHRRMVESSIGRKVERFVKGAGCNACNHTGFHGRVGVYELLKVTDEVRTLIVERATHAAIRAVALADGMRTMQMEAFALVASGVTTVDEVLKTVYAPMDDPGAFVQTESDASDDHPPVSIELDLNGAPVLNGEAQHDLVASSATIRDGEQSA